MADAGGRLRKELLEVNKEPEVSGVSAAPVDDDPRHLKATIKGPVGTPFEGGVFHLDIVIPDSYPFEPPKMKFTTRLWHPNVSSQTGAICLDILKDQWSPALTIKTTLVSLQALLSTPEPDDPQDAEVAGQYKSNFKDWEATAAFWTDTYAKERAAAADEEKIATLTAMGFTEEQASKALDSVGGDTERALEVLLSGG
mmetsp:Transcript_8682/g.20591  ORF Transcript_8682/g.20591 Transcript_8682/m.20591 type:complete len:198 (-) Transcript_8682:107-700(-)